MASGTRTKASIRLLLVEDDPAIRTLFEHTCESMGIELAIAADGTEALKRLEGDPPDAIVIDLGLPRLGGITIIEAVRATKRWKRVALVAYTGYDDPAIARAKAAGADAVLRKPAPPAEVITAALTIRARRPRLVGN